MDVKIILSIIAALVGTASFYPYLRDVINHKTKPHSYTWLIWVITQGTAIGGIWYGGGGIGALGLITGTVLVFVVFLSSLKYGTKNITKTDTAILITALLAIFVWWKLNNPLAAVLMVSAVDVLGYIPSYRKSFQEPWSETVITWVGFVIGNIFAILSLREYNLLTLSYIVSITFANTLLAVICLIRRQYVSHTFKA
jgi:hypothetical protein